MMIAGPAGQLKIQIDLPKTDPKSPIFIMCHPHPLYQGTMDNKVVTTTTRTFNRLGMMTVRFNFRGVGQSEGEYGDGNGELADTLAVIDYVTTHYSNRPIWLGGFSFGGVTAYRAAAERDITQLLSIAPGITRISTADAAEPTMPWVIIQSDADEIVAPEAVFDWVHHHQVPYYLVKVQGACHFFHGRLTELRDHLIRLYGALL